jgi:hypothetical protein
MAIVTSDGLVLRCYEDARREAPLGDLRTHTLAAVWANAKALRRRLATIGRDAEGRPCSDCDNIAHISPGSSVTTEPFWRVHPDAVALALRVMNPIAGGS